MSAPGPTRTGDRQIRRLLLYPLSYGGKATTVSPEVTDLPARIAAKVAVANDCWTWTGAVTSAGYSSVAFGGKQQSAHRVAYELLVGPIAAGLTIDHLCRNKLCINPSHLEPVTALENNRRKPLRDVCPAGHPMSGDNLRTYTRKNGIHQRQCRTCQRAAVRASYRRSIARMAAA